MIGIFIIIVMAIALIAAAGYGIMVLMDSSGISINLQRNMVRMDVIASAIKSSIRMENGQVMVPIGTLAGEYVARISPSIAPFSKTTWGKDIVYCPVSPNDPIDVTTSIRNGSSETYEVSVSLIGGIPYMSGGGPDNPALLAQLRERHVVGLLIAPDMTGSSASSPKCLDVTLSGDTFVVQGGDVTVVTDVQSDGTGYGRVFVLSPEGPVPPGAMVINSIENAASYIVNYSLPDATIILPDGEQSVRHKEFEELLAASAGRTIRLKGSGASILKIDYSGAPSSDEGVMQTDGTLLVTGVTFKGYVSDVQSMDIIAVVGPTGVLSLSDSMIGGLRVHGGKASLGNGAVIAPTYSASARSEPASVFGGSLFIARNDVPIILSAGAAAGLTVRGGDVSISGAIAMSLAPGGKAFVASGGGRISAASSSATVTVNNAAAIPLSASLTLSDDISVSGLGIRQNLVTSGHVICADGSEACEAICPTGSVLSWGECGSTNFHPVAGFEANADGTSWTCRWASAGGVIGPRARAVCSTLP